MAQYTCNNALAIDLMPALAKARLPFSIQWPRPDLAIFEGPESLIKYIVAEANHLNIVEKPTDKWGIWDDMSFPLTSPADLREGFEPTSNLNMWEDATHQITFDDGKHWTNVKLEGGMYVACSDGKRCWELRHVSMKNVVKRPIAPLTPDQEATVNEILAKRPDSYGTVTGRISDPQPVVYGGARGGPGKRTRGTPGGLTVKTCPYRHPPTATCPHCQDWERKRVPASVGESPACDYTDTCFDSDPSVVGE